MRVSLLLLLGACSQAGLARFDTGAPTGDTSAPAPTTDTAALPAVGTTVVLNELLASNAAGLTDEDGDHDDWIELYNPTGAQVDLSGWQLKDDSGADWTFPDGTSIPAGAWLLVWCDDATDGPLHASFKLSADGDAVTLSDADGAATDTIAFLAQQDDISWGRTPTDAAPNWGPLVTPTPGAPNGG